MRALLLVAFFALACTAAQARPFKDFCAQFEPLRKISDLEYVKPQIKVEPKTAGVKPQDVVFTNAAKAGTLKFSPGPDGVVELPLTEALCAENPDFESNQPKGTVAFNISIDPAIPPVKTLDYRLLESLRHQWDEAVSRQGFMMRVMAPSSKAYQILFEPGVNASAEMRLATGVRKLAANAKGELRIPFEAAWVAANPAIVLSEMPRKIGLAFE